MMGDEALPVYELTLVGGVDILSWCRGRAVARS